MVIRSEGWNRMATCIDAGKSGCPCALAEGGKCIICSKLNGGSCNDCNWQGMCIYSLYQQSGGKVSVRKERKMPIKEIREYSETFKVFVIEADKGTCQKAQEPGSYMFLRKPEDSKWYDTPISVLKSEPEKGLLHFGISAAGPKSRRLIGEQKTFCVRGIYYNGISNLNTLEVNTTENLVYGKGIAIAPFRNFLDMKERYSKYLKNLKLVYDDAKCGMDFFKDYFGDISVNQITIFDFSTEEFLQDTKERMNIFAFTSPYYAELIEKKHNQQIVKPSEGNFCCGEGICGACTFNGRDGETIHRCKYRL